MRYPKENASENRFLKNVLKTGGLKLVFYKTLVQNVFQKSFLDVRITGETITSSCS